MDITHVSPDVQIEWYHNKRIIAFVLKSNKRDAIDQWANAAIEIVTVWPPNQPYLAIYDVSGVAMLTPYGRDRADDIDRAAGHTTGAYTVLLPSTSFTKVFKTSVKRSLQKRNPKHELAIFTDKSEAMLWLEGFLLPAG